MRSELLGLLVKMELFLSWPKLFLITDALFIFTSFRCFLLKIATSLFIKGEALF